MSGSLFEEDKPAGPPRMSRWPSVCGPQSLDEVLDKDISWIPESPYALP
jgi:hypothetical protein